MANKTVLDTTGNKFNPEKAQLFPEEFARLFSDNLGQYPTTEEAAVLSLWQMVGSETALKPKEVSEIVNTAANLTQQEILSLRRTPPFLPPAINVLSLKEENGETVFEKVKKSLLNNGINYNPESDRQLTSYKYQLQAIKLLAEGIREEDIEAKIKKLLESGVSENSPQTKELKEALSAYESTLEKTKKSWQPSGPSSSKLFLSKFGTIIEKITPLEKLKSTLLGNIKSWFLNTTLGKPIKLALEKSAQKGLQAAWSASRIGIKKAAVPIAQKLLTFLGLGIKTAGAVATNVFGILAVVGIKLIGKTKDFFKKIFSSSVGVLGSILSGVTRASEVKESEDFKWLKWVIGGIIIFAFFFGFFEKKVKSGALINEDAELREPGFNIPGLPPQCETSRHYAEDVICVLKECGIEKVTSSSLSKTKECISKSNLQEKSVLEQEMSRLYEGYLQCIGFVDAVQKALGKSMGERRNACQYLSNPPTGYIYTDDPQVGDIAIWNEEGCRGGKKSTAAYWGHIAIVIQVNGNVKITVAETNGLNGIMRIVEYSYGHPDNDTDPTKFLRYNK